MDPFSAIGFAGNILTFVDFGWKLFTETRAIYESQSGITANERTVESIAKNVTELSNAITLSPVSDHGLRELADECRGVADDLLNVLQKLRLPKGRRKHESFLLAVRKVMKRGELDAFTARLQKLQLNLTIRIHWLLLNEHSRVVDGIGKIEGLNRRMRVENQENLVALRDEAAKYLKRLEGDTSKEVMAKLEESIVESKRIDTASAKEVSNLMRELSLRMSKLEESSKKADVFQKLLKSLYFDNLQDRHNSVHEAHSKTFEWIFERNTRFVDWLRHDNNIFWIQGKAGSGKSTLMKFLCRHRKLRKELRHWAGENKLVIAKYFFWNSGTKLQKSQEGLLRSLLFEILRVCPEIAAAIQSCRHDGDVGSNYTGSDWTREELLRAFEELQHTGVSANFCFFIDGLDEYKGDSLELLGTVQRLASLPGIKVCTSSRPWTHFVDAFGGQERSLIKLEDLTRTDIQHYVYDRLYSNRQFRELKDHDTAYADLANTIVSRAQGVFLWVVLVVRSLLEGAVYADSLEDMRRRLEMFPKDLEGYFQKIIDDIPEVYRVRTAVTFRIALAGDGPLPLSTYYFIDELVSDPYFALTLERRVLTSKDFHTIRRQMTARLDGRCKGLLEVVKVQSMEGPQIESPLRSRRVDFLHRTVKDFLMTPGLESVTFDAVSDSFDPYSTLCHAFLAEAKLTRTDLVTPVKDFVQYAALVEEEDVEPKQIDVAIYDMEKEYNSFLASNDESSSKKFVDLALRGELRWYIQQELTDGNLSPTLFLKEAFSLLDDAKMVESARLPDIIQSILAHNKFSKSHAVGVAGSEFVGAWLPRASQSSQQRREQIYEIARILVAHGLSANLWISGSGSVPGMTLADYLATQTRQENPNQRIRSISLGSRRGVSKSHMATNSIHLSGNRLEGTTCETSTSSNLGRWSSWLPWPSRRLYSART